MQRLQSLDGACGRWSMFIISASGSLLWEGRPSVLAEGSGVPASAVMSPYPIVIAFLPFSPLILRV